MFEKFDDRARRVVVLSQEHARMLGHTYIGTEHLLLAIAHEGESPAGRVFEQLKLSHGDIRDALVRVQGVAESQSQRGHLPFSDRGKHSFELALRVAREAGHGYIGPEHLLLGLIWGSDETQGGESSGFANLMIELKLEPEALVEMVGARLKGTCVTYDEALDICNLTPEELRQKKIRQLSSGAEARIDKLERAADDFLSAAIHAQDLAGEYRRRLAVLRGAQV